MQKMLDVLLGGKRYPMELADEGGFFAVLLDRRELSP